MQLKRGGVTGLRRLFAVTRSHGPAWDESLALDMQPGWQAHAEFMNGLAAERLIVIGGTLEGTGDTLLIFRAESEEEVRRRLAADPWGKEMLKLARIVPWQLRLGENRLAV